MLQNFDVIREPVCDLDDGVVLFGTDFDRCRPVLVFVPHDAVQKRFKRTRLTQKESDFLVSSDREAFRDISSKKYAAGKVEAFPSRQGRPLSLVRLNSSDLDELAPIDHQSIVYEFAKTFGATP